MPIMPTRSGQAVPTRRRGWTGAQDSRQDRGPSASPNIKTNKQTKPGCQSWVSCIRLVGKRRSPGGCQKRPPALRSGGRGGNGGNHSCNPVPAVHHRPAWAGGIMPMPWKAGARRVAMGRAAERHEGRSVAAHRRSGPRVVRAPSAAGRWVHCFHSCPRLLRGRWCPCFCQTIRATSAAFREPGWPSVISGTAASAFDKGSWPWHLLPVLEGCVVHARHLGLQRERNAVDDKPIALLASQLRPWCQSSSVLNPALSAANEKRYGEQAACRAHDLFGVGFPCGRRQSGWQSRRGTCPARRSRC